MMRRLPVYFLVDSSESMVGTPIKAVREGIHQILAELRRDPYALETVFISIIAFAGKAVKITPLTELTRIMLPQEFSIGSGTSLGDALQLLMESLDNELVKPSPERKGDWKPVVFLMTDGNPTDSYEKQLSIWEQKYRSKLATVAISFGDSADGRLLSRFAESVFQFNDSAEKSYTSLFKWVTASIKSTSQSVMERNRNQDGVVEPTDENIKRIDLTKGDTKRGIDQRYAILFGKCQQKKEHYLIKYRSMEREFHLEGIYPIDASYFEMSGSSKGELPPVGTESLRGEPACPFCGKGAMCQCACGKLHCGGLGRNTCPWCGITGEYAAGEFQVERGRG